LSKREREILKLIEDSESLRNALLGESKDSLLRFLNADTETRELFRQQFTMNHLKDLCNDCSKCCEDTEIDLTPYDVERMSAHLGISQSAFVSEYCVPHPKHRLFLYRLKQKPCVFLKDKKCTVYSARPNVCIFFPFFSFGIQEGSWQIYEKQNRPAITVPVWCPSGLKTKEVSDKLDEMISKLAHQ
jgi:Fe-S-cluster containining protein